MVGPAMVTAPLIGALSDKVGRKSLIVFLMAFTTVLTVAIPLGGQQYSPVDHRMRRVVRVAALHRD